ncbi:hypothetical protein DES53_109139 [Roseimicrobium gellanilyticum]|uniref:DUF3108 domain-containing protein n=1 Tax=Roseimicrobium gellanilyticum TaxID=748857 RepID=A0A366HBG8_9BACT|nr:DUF6263 family protein [Roseimicrobium gellanilyticum]RBP39712.1 hypothetical protein DES53_109139 [Roseimicrobium gellanilyticum]
MKRLLLSLAVLIAAHPLLAQKEVLRSHWEPGKLYKYEQVTSSTTSVPGAPKPEKSDVAQTFQFRVTAEPATGNKLAEFSLTGVKATMDIMGQSHTYDSADPAKSPPFLQQTFGALLNKSVTLVFDKDDKYVETRGSEKLQPTPLGNTVSMDGKQIADAWRKSFETFLPKNPASVGDTWNIEEKMEMPPVAVVIKGAGRFDSVVEVEGRKHAKLLVDGSLSTSPGASSITGWADGSKFTAETLFDQQQRVIVRNETRTEMHLQMQGQTVPMKQIVTMKLLSLEDAK